MTNFHVGQKVVCVNSEPYHYEIPANAKMIGGMDGLQEGAVYVVRDIFLDPYHGSAVVRLFEIVRLPFARVMGVYYEAGFDPIRFRPVVTTKTDISIFRSMLNPSKQKEEV